METQMTSIISGFVFALITICLGFTIRIIVNKTQQLKSKINSNNLVVENLDYNKNMSNITEWQYIDNGPGWGSSAQISPCGKFILVKESKSVAGHNAAGEFPRSTEYHLISTENFTKTKSTGNEQD